MDGKMTVLVVEPGKAPYRKEIESGLQSLQREVGGYIEACYPFDDPVALVLDDEGKINGKPLNRALRDADGNIYDVIAGTFLVVGLGEETFTSLPAELMEVYRQKFLRPEAFVNLGGKLYAFPIEEVANEQE